MRTSASMLLLVMLTTFGVVGSLPSASAHASGVVLSAFGSATVDGVISPGEYGSCIGPTTQGNYSFTICETNDNTNDYYAVKINDLTNNAVYPDDSIGFLFDDDHNGLVTRCGSGEEDFLLLRAGTPGFIDDSICFSGGLVTLTGETSDGAGALRFTAGVGYEYEISHPLYSGDTRDYSLSGGSVLGFCFRYGEGAIGNVMVVEFPVDCLSNADASGDASDWGDIVKLGQSTGGLLWTQTSRATPPGGDQAFGVAVEGAGTGPSGMSRGVYIVGAYLVLNWTGNLGWRIDELIPGSGGINWTRTSDPSPGIDLAYGVAVYGSGVYTVGSDQSPGPGDDEWRIEKMDWRSVAVIWTQTSNPTPGSDVARAVAAASSGLYVVGYDESQGNRQWRIENRDFTFGGLNWTRTSNPSPGADEAHGVAVDGTGLYVVGFDASPGNEEWRIEKWDHLRTVSLLWAQTSNPSSGSDQASGVAVDGSGLYVVGWDNSPGNGEWRIEKRNLGTGAVTWTQTSNPSSGNDYALAVAVDATGLYVVGIDESPGNWQWRIEKRDLATGGLLWTQTSNPSSYSDWAYGVAVDGSGVYVAGSDQIPGAGYYEWRVEKRETGAPAQTITTICTICPTSTTTSNVTTIITTTTPPRNQCLIATAVYGSELAPEVQLLRNFRDNSILKTRAGSNFMIAFNAWYYSFSPQVAQFIAGHSTARTGMKLVLYPLIGILKLSSIVFDAAAAYPEFAALLSGLVASSLIGAFYLALPIGLLRAKVRQLGGSRLQRMLEILLGLALLSGIGALLIGEVFALPLVLTLSTSTIVLAALFLSASFTSAIIAGGLQTKPIRATSSTGRR